MRRVPFSYFARSDSFSAVSRALGPFYMFYALGLIFGGIECVGSRFHVLCTRTRFRRCRGRRVPFSSFARPDSFSAVPRAWGLVFMFCMPRLIFGDTEGVGSRFLILCSRTHFGRCRMRRVPFSYFTRTYSFSAMPRASVSVFIFCPPRLVFGDAEGVRSRFHILPAQTRFRRCRGCWVPFSCFVLPDSFSAVPNASVPVFIFFLPGLVFGGTEGVGSHFHILRVRTRFWRSCGRRVPFSYFACMDSFSSVPRASGPVFMPYARELVFDGTEGVGFRFHVLRSQTRFSAMP
jgi:hypothetical protein